MRKSRIILILLMLGLVSACVKDKLDFDMLEDIRLRPELELPLVKARLTLADVVARDTSNILQIDGDNLVRIAFSQDNLFSFAPGDLVEIPAQDPQNFPVVVGQPPLNLNMSLGTIGGVELGTAEFYQGKFVLGLSSAVPLTDDVSVKVTINNAQYNTQVFAGTVTLSSGNTLSHDSLSLPGVVFDFTNGGQDVNYISLGLEVVNPPVTLTGTPLELSLQFVQLELEYTSGYFGDRLATIPSGDFDLDLSVIDKLADGFKIVDPSIGLVVTSNFGLPVELSPDIDGVNAENKVVPLEASPQLIPGAQDTAIYDTTRLIFDAQNSNLANFISALPSKVLYSGSAQLNPAGYTMNNFLSRNSLIDVGIEIEMPLELSIENMLLNQDLTGITLFKENPEEIEEFTLIFNSSNGFPFELDMQVAFLDSTTGDSIYGFNLGLLNPAVIGANGEILQRGVYASAREVTFDRNSLEILQRTSAIRFKAILNTPQNGQKVEKFYAHFDTEINIATRVKLDLNPSAQ